MQSLILSNPREFIAHPERHNQIEVPIGERVKVSIIRELTNLNWRIVHNNGSIEMIPPTSYNREAVKRAMSIKRAEILKRKSPLGVRASKNARFIVSLGMGTKI